MSGLVARTTEYGIGSGYKILKPKPSVIIDPRCHEGGTRLVSYMVSDDAGGELLRNGKFLRVRREQDRGAASS